MENPRLAVGSVFANRFEIELTAGSGGMGTVYRARDRYSGDIVALKLLHKAASEPEQGDRFAREAQLLAGLRHPSIVGYVAHGQTPEGQRFLAMEWLAGHDLAHHLSLGTLALRDALTIVRRVAEALAVTHQCGIVHRDLKPTNLFLPDGDITRCKLLDFGIARRVGSVMTRTGAVVGTPDYMSPEQARGVRELTTATDIFSLGCVLYECLTGSPPFAADYLAAVLVRILFEQPPAIATRRPGTPAAVVALLDHMLHKDPAQRLADGAQLLRALAPLGEAPELLLPLTLDAAPAPLAVFAKREQTLFSLVVAAAPAPSQSADRAPSVSYPPIDSAQRSALLSALRALGTQAEFLADDMLVVTVLSTGSAQDQAGIAARAALLIKERWPAATVVLTTGRGSSQGSTAVGEVADRAVQILGQRSGEPRADAANSTSGVWLDELSGRLLVPRFAVSPTAQGLLLLSEEKEADESRPLLGKPTQLVGRDAELSNLDAQLNSCCEESEARAVLITAPAGVGKSRLRHEFLRRVAKRSECITVLLGRGNVMSAGAPYGILGAAIVRLCGLSQEEPLAVQQQLVRARIAQHVATAEKQRVVEFIGELCNVPFPDDGRPMLQAARQDPKVMRDCLYRAFADWLAAECASAPVLLVLDDLQWGDELTVALLGEALRLHERSPLLIVAFARPEVEATFPSLWQTHKVQEIPLKGLSRKACERLIQQVLGPTVSKELVARAAEQSAGNALFLEELIRTLAEGKSAERPETVLAMLQARIGRLDAGPRRAVRAASIFGETFWRGGLLALLGSERDTLELEAWLQQLTAAELIAPSPVSRYAKEAEYTFRHALVRDAVYGLLTEEDQQLGHRLASRYLEHAGERDPMTLAEHAQLGGDVERAIPLYIRAAEHSHERHDFGGARLRADRGIASGAKGTELGTLRAIQFASAYWLGSIGSIYPLGREAIALLPTGSPWWCRAMMILFIISSHAEPAQLGELVQLFSGVTPTADAHRPYVEAASWLIVMFSFVGQPDIARSFLAPMLQAAEVAGQFDANVRGFAGNAHAWFLRMLAPAPYTALTLIKRSAEAFAEVQNHRDLMVSYMALGMMLGELGDAPAGEQVLRSALADVERRNDAFLSMNLRAYLALLFAARDGEESARATIEIVTPLLATKVSPIYTAMALTALAQAQLTLGDLTAAEVTARAGLEIQAWKPYTITLNTTLVNVLLRQGRATAACTLAESMLHDIAALGCTGHNEVAARLAASEAYQQAGEITAAHQNLRAAHRQLQLRLDDIPDPALRARFIAAIPAHARVVALAQDWLGIAAEARLPTADITAFG